MAKSTAVPPSDRVTCSSPRKKASTAPKPAQPASNKRRKANNITTTAGSKKRGKKEVDDTPESDDVKEGKMAVEGDVKVVWDTKLSESLLKAINEDSTIKQGLYPGVGNAESKETDPEMGVAAGGQTKTTWFWKLAQVVFLDHELYGESVRLALKQYQSKPKSTALQKKWTDKIKNRLTTMQNETLKYNKTRGQTGMGLKSAKEIDGERNAELASKWDEIKEECPWYFDMKELIGDRPNRTPVGLGNITTPIDVTALDADDDAIPSNEADTSSDVAYDVKPRLKDEDEDDVEPELEKDVKPDLKRKLDQIGSKNKDPAPKRTNVSEFADLAAIEEATEQKRLELAKAKVEARTKLKLEESRAKSEKMKLKVEYKLAKLKLRTQLQQQQPLQAGLVPSGSSTAYVSPHLTVALPSHTQPFEDDQDLDLYAAL
ncbi:hypothetical protein DFP72DRAFT_1060126 [Ephemerocybe angulata]|uniref:Uncharacterized protein n=1 Tax=Ephemerocybe angulata TaxID=980116 RepID=A0A8H6IEV9_9AGAR|nr:hypothetical protein DFP72DRAFT_1060126 [Tulosesus angulatus]